MGVDRGDEVGMANSTLAGLGVERDATMSYRR